MPKIRVELGKRAYLFKNANQYAPSVIISAHGFYTDASGMYNPGNRVLKFYCKDGEMAALDGDIMPGQDVPRANVVSCHDYTLFKLQEHKATIKRSAAEEHITFAQAERNLNMFGETYAKFTDSNSAANDYVTIRNRHSAFGGPLITLSALIALIEQTHAYATYKCKFCREHKANGYVPNLNADR